MSFTRRRLLGFAPLLMPSLWLTLAPTQVAYASTADLFADTYSDTY
jgi:hypothetical protein